MLSPQQVVFLEDAEAIEKLSEKNRDEAVAQLGAYLEDPAPFTVLVVEATEPGSTHEIGKAAGGENSGGGMRAWRKRGERQAAAVVLRGDWERAGSGIRKRPREDLAEFVAADLMG